VSQSDFEMLVLVCLVMASVLNDAAAVVANMQFPDPYGRLNIVNIELDRCIKRKTWGCKISKTVVKYTLIAIYQVASNLLSFDPRRAYSQ
jgi:hypothetical protein